MPLYKQDPDNPGKQIPDIQGDNRRDRANNPQTCSFHKTPNYVVVNTALNQKDVVPRGHAIECRINAEDASKNFQPSPGRITMCHQPSGFRTRVDGAIYQGYKVTPFYDSMICKLICHGRNREEAIQRMMRSLDEFVIEGITTTIDLHKKLLSHKKFLESDFNVSWLDKDKVI